MPDVNRLTIHERAPTHDAGNGALEALGLTGSASEPQARSFLKTGLPTLAPVLEIPATAIRLPRKNSAMTSGIFTISPSHRSAQRSNLPAYTNYQRTSARLLRRRPSLSKTRVNIVLFVRHYHQATPDVFEYDSRIQEGMLRRHGNYAPPLNKRHYFSSHLLQ
jgi:hypothetical protein